MNKIIQKQKCGCEWIDWGIFLSVEKQCPKHKKRNIEHLKRLMKRKNDISKHS